ncbi:hypothetical protein [Aneurinibacillus sp. REN35]|uniref:hypothetical protein n=1 Tax=Aneurinibacillus sp. REN35 TaxID=3237286 RepID=UPI0035282818
MLMKLPIHIHEGIAIGVIGPQAIVHKVRHTLKAFPSFAPSFHIYENETQALVLAEKVMQTAEVLLICEYHVYRVMKGTMDFAIPVHYIPLTGSGLFSALFRLKKAYGIHALSIDSISQSFVAQVFQELDEVLPPATYFEGASIAAAEEVIRFHKENVHSGEKTAVLTGMHSVACRLMEADIPYEWVIPAQQDITNALERALLSTETRRKKETQIVVGIVQVDGFGRVSERLGSEHDIQRLKLDTHRMLLDYVKCLDGYLTTLGEAQYLFFTTRGIFERETRGYKTIPLLQDSKTSLGVSLSMGIGFGKSANEAGTHARLALRQAAEAGGNICFIVREDRSVIGPVEFGHPMVYELSITDLDLLDKAEKAGMTAAYMSRLMAQVARQGKLEYTAQELASIIGVTLRSTHRILLQWLDAELVEIVGVEKISAKGRPRQIYRLSFIADQLEEKWMNVE